jgi:hypothetical protein
MTVRVLRYSVGNEHNPGDPWGRSELTIQPDGSASLEHHFSRAPRVDAWTGQVDPGALAALWAGLARAGFPATSRSTFTAGASLRRLTVETDGQAESAIVDWHEAPKLPGYAEAFDVLDGVIRQLSGDSVPYPTTQPTIVSGVTSAPAPPR